MAGRGNLFQDAGFVGGVLTNREEDGAGAMRGQRLEHRRRALRPGTVVEGQNDLALIQEVVFAEMLEAETGTAAGVDLDRARDAERVRIAWTGLGECSCGHRENGKCNGASACCKAHSCLPTPATQPAAHRNYTCPVGSFSEL